MSRPAACSLLAYGCQQTSPKRQRGCRAFTLVEMLVAMVLTLIMVAAIAEFYAYVGDTVRDGRAMIEMSSQLRAAVQRLKSDFDQITCSVVPWADDGAAQGYFEYREGRIVLTSGTLNALMANDYDSNANDIVDGILAEDSDSNGQNDLDQLGVTNLLGDGDDYLAFTIRSNGAPFTGRHQTLGIANSQLAEVAWFTGFTDRDGDGVWDFDEPRTVYRRQLLIRPDLGQFGTDYLPNQLAAAQLQIYQLQQLNDVSLGIYDAVNSSNQPVIRIKANSLADLTRREHRFAHQNGTLSAPNFPNQLLLNPTDATSLTTFTLQGDSFGEDIVLSNVLAFDVRAFDPQAVLRQDTDSSTTPVNALAPSDPGYLMSVVQNNPITGTGAYVDLGYGLKLFEQLQKNPHSMSANAASQLLFGVNNPYDVYNYNPSALGRLGNSALYYAQPPVAGPTITGAALNSYLSTIGCTYDTWSLGYERDGFNQDVDSLGGQPLFDEGTNGVDDDGANGVDDYRERETVPPYPQPLRGLQVKIRIYEASTRQMRQATVTTDFLAE